jgi:hypothetical protein
LKRSVKPISGSLGGDVRGRNKIVTVLLAAGRDGDRDLFLPLGAQQRKTVTAMEST